MHKLLKIISVTLFSFGLFFSLVSNAGVLVSDIEKLLGPQLWQAGNINGNTCAYNLAQNGLITSVYKNMGVAIGFNEKNEILCELIGGHIHATYDPNKMYLGAPYHKGGVLNCSDPKNKCFLISTDEQIFLNQAAAARAKYEDIVVSATRNSSKNINIMYGSGFFIAENGLFITNYHVIEGAQDIYITGSKGLKRKAYLLRVDKKNDLALLSVKGGAPGVLRISRSSGIGRGLKVYALGFPLPTIQGQELKLTDGIISSLSGLRDEPTTFQISNAIQPGNSGGPLINEAGQVVGVIVSRLSSNYVMETYGVLPQNVNYAIKSNYLIEFIESIGSLSIRFEQLRNDKDKNYIKNAELATGFVVVRK